MAKSHTSTQPKLRIVPLGGLGEIGKNMTVFELGNDAIVVDTGLMFPANDMLGVDYIIPDFRYLQERKDLKIHAFLYTHGHEDHTGAVTHVINAFQGVPIYATPLTAGLLSNKLKEARLTQMTTVHTFTRATRSRSGRSPSTASTSTTASRSVSASAFTRRGASSFTPVTTNSTIRRSTASPPTMRASPRFNRSCRTTPPTPTRRAASFC